MNDYFSKSSTWPTLLACRSDEEKALLVQIAIAQLPAPDREAVFALFYDNQTEEDLGVRFGITKGGVYMRMLKVKRRLRSRLEKLIKEA